MILINKYLEIKMNSPSRFIQRMIVFIILNLVLGFFLISSLVDAFLTNPIINGLIFSVLAFWNNNYI